MEVHPSSPELVEQLAVSALVRGLRPEIAGELASRGREQSHAPDELLFREGQPPTALWLVLAGEVVVYRDAVGKPLQLRARLGPGEFFGEMSLLGEHPHSSSARCAGSTRLFRIERADLTEVLEAFPELLLRLEMTAIQRHGRNAQAALDLADRDDVRIRVDRMVRVVPTGGEPRAMRLENLSPGGICLSDAPLSWREGKVIELALGTLTGPALFAGRMRVVWRRDETVGLAYESAGDEPLRVPELLSRLLGSE